MREGIVFDTHYVRKTPFDMNPRVCDRCQEATTIVKVLSGDTAYSWLCRACGGPSYNLDTLEVIGQ
jgi:hypothetical protein